MIEEIPVTKYFSNGMQLFEPKGDDFSENETLMTVSLSFSVCLSVSSLSLSLTVSLCLSVSLSLSLSWYKLLQWMFFILCDNWKTLVFTKVSCPSECFWNYHFAAFFERSTLKEICSLRYFHNNITMVMPKFKNEVCTCYML